MREDETHYSSRLEDWQKQSVMSKLVTRGYNPITAEFALLSVNYKSVEMAHIFLSGTDPYSKKLIHPFLSVIHGPPLCAICRLDRVQHSKAYNDGPRIQAPS
jgi:hypothetical protein